MFCLQVFALRFCSQILWAGRRVWLWLSSEPSAPPSLWWRASRALQNCDECYECSTSWPGCRRVSAVAQGLQLVIWQSSRAVLSVVRASLMAVCAWWAQLWNLFLRCPQLTKPEEELPELSVSGCWWLCNILCKSNWDQRHERFFILLFINVRWYW